MHPDPLTAHYVELVRFVEQTIAARVPRMFAPKPLTEAEVHILAQGFTAGHRIAEQQREAA